MRFTKRQVEEAIRNSHNRGINTALAVGFVAGAMIGMWTMVFLVGLHVIHIDFAMMAPSVKVTD